MGSKGEVRANMTTMEQPQNRQALSLANEVRRRRAEDKRRIKCELGPAVYECLFADHWRSAQICDLLMAIPKVGRTRMRRILGRIPMSEFRTIGTMTAREKGALRLLLVENGFYPEI